MLHRLPFTRRGALRRLIEEDQRPPVVGARVLCVASGKGGTGKSVVATNLATLRAQQGERVLLVDFDAGLANAHLLLGLAPRSDLGHVAEGAATARQAMVEGPFGLQLLSGGVGRAALVDPTRRELDRLFRALEPLETEFDLIVVDHGAGMGFGTIAHLAATSTLLLVTSHEVTALSDPFDNALTDAGREQAAGAPAPWTAVAGENESELMALRDLAHQVLAATRQVAHAGTAAQIEAAQAVLRDARKALYRLLAEDEDAS